jgi:hypothetical protein
MYCFGIVVVPTCDPKDLCRVTCNHVYHMNHRANMGRLEA